MSLFFDSRYWGTTEEDIAASYPCDEILPNCSEPLYRAITISASKETVFAWLCQMRVAPYSYDWIDNFGKQSPRELNPELQKLELAQVFMVIFKLLSFEKNKQITIGTSEKGFLGRVFGHAIISYQLQELSEKETRLQAKLLCHYPSGIIGWLMKVFLPTGDLIMMRKQLLTFKHLAEKTQG